MSRKIRAGQWAIVIAFIAYGVLMCRHASDVIGGADSSGYINAARLFSEGRVARPIPIPPELHVENLDAFLPAAFIRQGQTSMMVPFYPIGFPLHLLAAAWIGGWNAAPFYVSPLATVAVVVLTFFLTRRFATTTTAFIAAVCMACCPVLIAMGLQAMSDVTATMWCTAAVLAATYDNPRAAVLAGASLGMAVLVRPTSALMVIPLAIALRPKQYPWAVIGGAPFALGLALYNWHAFGSPLSSGYTNIGLLDAVHAGGFEDRAGYYLDWTVRQLGPAVLIAWLSSLSFGHAPVRVRAALAAWFGSFLIFYACYDVYGAWWYTRFLLPAYPALIVLTAWMAETLYRRGTRTAIASAIAIVLATLIPALMTARRFDVLSMEEIQRPNRLAGEWLARNLPPRSIVVSGEMSGAILYYTSHYPLRWDAVNGDEMRAYIATAAAHGRRSFVIVMREEVPGVEARYGPLKKALNAPPPFRAFRLDVP